jgi:hypothetical protein
MKHETEVKTPWEKPQLIIMARSKPEEMVLLVCKYAGPEEGPIASNVLVAHLRVQNVPRKLPASPLAVGR